MSQQVIRRQSQLNDSIQSLDSLSTTDIKQSEVDDVARVVFGSSEVPSQVHSNDSVAVQQKLNIHDDPHMNNDILRLGTKLAKNSSIQTGLLQELTHDWSLLSNINVQQQLLTHSTTLSGGTRIASDTIHNDTHNNTINTTRHHISMDSSSEISPSSRMSDWSSDESFNYIDLEDNELARSFSSLQRAISATTTPTNMERRYSNRSVESISEESAQYDELHGWSATGSHIQIHIPITTPPTPAQRQRSASNYVDALKELQLDFNTDSSDNVHEKEQSVVSKLMYWLKSRVFGSENVDELDIDTTMQDTTEPQHSDTIHKVSTNTTLTLLQRIQAKTEEMQAYHSSGTYTNLALGVAAILIALVLCKRYSPILYAKLVKMLHNTKPFNDNT